MTPEQIESRKRRKVIDDAATMLGLIDNTLDDIQHNLAEIGCDYIAYGSIARAMGNVAEAMCEIKKESQE